MLGHLVAMRYVESDSSAPPRGIARRFHDVSAIVGEIDEARGEANAFRSNRMNSSPAKDLWPFGSSVQSRNHRSSIEPAKRSGSVFHRFLEREGPRVCLPSGERGFEVVAHRGAHVQETCAGSAAQP